MICTALQQAELEVGWYRQHGKHKDRIRIDFVGNPYVVGDWSWNKANPYRQESIKEQLADHIAETITGIKK